MTSAEIEAITNEVLNDFTTLGCIKPTPEARDQAFPVILMAVKKASSKGYKEAVDAMGD